MAFNGSCMIVKSTMCNNGFVLSSLQIPMKLWDGGPPLLEIIYIGLPIHHAFLPVADTASGCWPELDMVPRTETEATFLLFEVIVNFKTFLQFFPNTLARHLTTLGPPITWEEEEEDEERY